MNPEIPLRIAAVLAGFMLKTTLAFAICWAWSFLVASPGGKFMAWLGFLTGVGAYWLWLAKALFVAGPLAGLAGAGILPLSHSAVGAWQIPSSWALPLSIALRAAGILYLLTLSYFLLSQIRKRLHLRWVLRFAYPPPAEIAEVFQSIAATSRFGRSRLLVLSGIPSPATFGWIPGPRFCCLLSVWSRTAASSKIFCVTNCSIFGAGILWQTHLRQPAARWSASILAAWCAMRKMQLQRELACDLAVVSDSPEKRAKYGRVPGPLCSVFLHGSRGPEAVGYGFRRFCRAFKDAGSFGIGRVEETLPLAAPAARRLWTASFRRLSRHRTVARHPLPYLPQQVALTMDRGGALYRLRCDGSKSGQKSPAFNESNGKQPGTTDRGKQPAGSRSICSPGTRSPDRPRSGAFLPRRYAARTTLCRRSPTLQTILRPPVGRLRGRGAARQRMPSVTSVIAGAAGEIARLPDHDHDKELPILRLSLRKEPNFLLG